MKKNTFRSWSRGTYDYLNPPRRKLVDRFLIHVSLHREGDELIVSISDNGPGIPAGAELGDGSLGLKLVENLATGLGGTFSIAPDRHRADFRYPSIHRHPD